MYVHVRSQPHTVTTQCSTQLREELLVHVFRRPYSFQRLLQAPGGSLSDGEVEWRGASEVRGCHVRTWRGGGGGEGGKKGKRKERREAVRVEDKRGEERERRGRGIYMKEVDHGHTYTCSNSKCA